MGKSTISMAIFHCYVSHYQRVSRCFNKMELLQAQHMEHAIWGTLLIGRCPATHTAQEHSAALSSLRLSWQEKSVPACHWTWPWLAPKSMSCLLSFTTKLRCHMMSLPSFMFFHSSPDVEPAHKEHNINLKLIRLAIWKANWYLIVIHPLKWSLSLRWVLGHLSTLWQVWFDSLSKCATRSDCSKLNARALRSRVPKGVVDALCILTCFAEHKGVSKINNPRIHLCKCWWSMLCEELCCLVLMIL